jgi:hypothetical protein
MAGGVIAADPLGHLTETSPWALGAAGLAYPVMMGAYSNPGRGFLTGLLGQVAKVPPAVAPYGPLGGQLASGLLNQNQP